VVNVRRDAGVGGSRACGVDVTVELRVGDTVGSLARLAVVHCVDRPRGELHIGNGEVKEVEMM
jgi:hypothetical protein